MRIQRLHDLQLFAPLLALGALLAAPAAAQNQSFNFTGATQQFAVPPGVCEIVVDAAGAAGGASGGVAQPLPGALGGRAIATIAVTPGEMLEINVGGMGGNGVLVVNGLALGGIGGFNGGGPGGDGADTDTTSQNSSGGGGGGASDVRQGGTTLGDRVVVAGGGGGAGGFVDVGGGGGGGGGGGLSGVPGASGVGASNPMGGGAGTQAGGGNGGINDSIFAINGVAGSGVSGIGGAGGSITGSSPGIGTSGGGGGGGGGFNGGGGGGGVAEGGGEASGGGGGSGLGPVGVVFQTAVRAGDGQVDLSWTVDPSCAPVPVRTGCGGP